MHDPLIDGGVIRKLWISETDLYRDHLLRLEKDSRRLRFAHSVSDGFIEDYASRMAEYGSVAWDAVSDRTSASMSSSPRASMIVTPWSPIGPETRTASPGRACATPRLGPRSRTPTPAVLM